MRATGAMVRLTVSPGAAQRHGLGHLLAQASPQPQQRHVVSDKCGESETRDTCGEGETRDTWTGDAVRTSTVGPSTQAGLIDT